MKHGAYPTYTNHRCRCRRCRVAWARYVRNRRWEREAEPVPEHVHASENGYGNYGCRCRPCTDAHSAASLERRHRHQGREAA